MPWESHLAATFCTWQHNVDLIAPVTCWFRCLAVGKRQLAAAQHFLQLSSRQKRDRKRIWRSTWQYGDLPVDIKSLIGLWFYDRCNILPFFFSGFLRKGVRPNLEPPRSIGTQSVQENVRGVLEPHRWTILRRMCPEDGLAAKEAHVVIKEIMEELSGKAEDFDKKLAICFFGWKI